MDDWRNVSKHDVLKNKGKLESVFGHLESVLCSLCYWLEYRVRHAYAWHNLIGRAVANKVEYIIELAKANNELGRIVFEFARFWVEQWTKGGFGGNPKAILADEDGAIGLDAPLLRYFQQLCEEGQSKEAGAVQAFINIWAAVGAALAAEYYATEGTQEAAT